MPPTELPNQALPFTIKMMIYFKFFVYDIAGIFVEFFHARQEEFLHLQQLIGVSK